MKAKETRQWGARGRSGSGLLSSHTRALSMFDILPRRAFDLFHGWDACTETKPAQPRSNGWDDGHCYGNSAPRGKKKDTNKGNKKLNSKTWDRLGISSACHLGAGYLHSSRRSRSSPTASDQKHEQLYTKTISSTRMLLNFQSKYW